MRTIIVQRVVPHYRVPVFQKLYDELGWVVVAAGGGPSFGLKTDTTAEWLSTYDFQLDPKQQYSAKVPIDRILADHRPDMVIAEFSLQMSSTWSLVRAAPFRRKPYLTFWSQGWNRERGFRRPGDLAVQLVRLGMLSVADAQLCYSREGAAFLTRYLPGRPATFVAQNTLDVTTMPGRDIDASPSGNGQARLLSLGRLTHDKRVPMLVSAFRRALADLPGLTLTIVGDGPDMAAVRAAAEGLGDRVEILGAVYDEQRIASLLQEASLMVSAGSVGLAVNHALAYGVPVMLYENDDDVRHHPEHNYVIDGVTGFRVAEPNEAALAGAIVRECAGPSPKARLRPGIMDYVDRELSIDRMLEGFRALNRHFSGR